LFCVVHVFIHKLYPNVDVKIILIAKQIPDQYLEYKDNLILFEPIEGILTSFISQFIRLLYPCILHYQHGVMITDMDMLPMSKTYYHCYRPMNKYSDINWKIFHLL